MDRVSFILPEKCMAKCEERVRESHGNVISHLLLQ